MPLEWLSGGREPFEWAWGANNDCCAVWPYGRGWEAWISVGGAPGEYCTHASEAEAKAWCERQMQPPMSEVSNAT